MTQMYHFGNVPEELHPSLQGTYVLVLKAPLSSIAKLLSELPSPPHTGSISGKMIYFGLREQSLLTKSLGSRSLKWLVV